MGRRLYGTATDPLDALTVGPLRVRSGPKGEHDAMSAESAEHAELQRWRGWAQFVYLGGGPVTLTDDELRAAVCAAHDRQVQDTRENIERSYPSSQADKNR